MPTARPALPSSLRIPLGVVAVLAAAVVVVLGVTLSGQDQANAFDRWISSAIQPSVPEPKAQFTPAWFVSGLGDPAIAGVLVLILVAICWRMRRKRLAILAVAGPAATGLVTTVLKPVIGRTINDGHLSYPSGHTASLTALGIIVGLLLVGRFALGRVAGTVLVLGLAVVAGAVMGWAQTGIVVHYATDTVGGCCVALALVPAAAWVVDRVADRR